MSDEKQFQFITNPNQLPAPPKLRKKIVELPDWPALPNGKFPQFCVQELTALEAAQYQRSLRVYENGRHIGSDNENADLKLLSFILRDTNGNRPWPTPEDSVKFFGPYGLRPLNPLLEAYFEMSNSSESVEDIEGKSETTQTS